MFYLFKLVNWLLKIYEKRWIIFIWVKLTIYNSGVIWRPWTMLESDIKRKSLEKVGKFINTLPWILFSLIQRDYLLPNKKQDVKLCCHPNLHLLIGCHQQSVWNCVLMSTALMEPLVQFQLMRGNRWNWDDKWKWILSEVCFFDWVFYFDAVKNYVKRIETIILTRWFPLEMVGCMRRTKKKKTDSGIFREIEGHAHGGGGFTCIMEPMELVHFLNSSKNRLSQKSRNMSPNFLLWEVNSIFWQEVWICHVLFSIFAFLPDRRQALILLETSQADVISCVASGCWQFFFLEILSLTETGLIYMFLVLFWGGFIACDFLQTRGFTGVEGKSGNRYSDAAHNALGILKAVQKNGDHRRSGFPWGYSFLSPRSAGESPFCMQILDVAFFPLRYNTSSVFLNNMFMSLRFMSLMSTPVWLPMTSLVLNGTTCTLTLPNSCNVSMKGYNATMKVCQYLGCRRYSQAQLHWLEHWCKEPFEEMRVMFWQHILFVIALKINSITSNPILITEYHSESFYNIQQHSIPVTLDICHPFSQLP